MLAAMDMNMSASSGDYNLVISNIAVGHPNEMEAEHTVNVGNLYLIWDGTARGAFGRLNEGTSEACGMENSRLKWVLLH